MCAETQIYGSWGVWSGIASSCEEIIPVGCRWEGLFSISVTRDIFSLHLNLNLAA